MSEWRPEKQAGGVFRLAVIGQPIAHSRSPVMHTAAFEALGGKIQDLMFVFGDLVDIDDRGMQEVLRQVPGEKLPATTIIPSVLITKENAKDFYHPNSPF
mgnify:CR=1 FL=1